MKQVPFLHQCVIIKIVAVTLTLLLSGCLCDTDLHHPSSLTVSQERKTILYINQGETANLPCETGLSADASSNKTLLPKWTKLKKPHKKDDDDHDDDNDNKKETEMSEKCHEANEGDKSYCLLVVSNKKSESNQNLVSTLRIIKVTNDDYGTYVCRNNHMELNRVDLRDALRVTRRSMIDNSTERSVILQEDEILHLYCNYTGLGKEHKISWFKDNDNITEDLMNPSTSKLFENFTVTPLDDLGIEYKFEGSARNEHRGTYKCSVDLKNKNETNAQHKNSEDKSIVYPVEYSFTVRVRDGNRWMLPGLILLGEIVLLAIFTAIIWKRESSGGEDAADGDFADSEDEEDEKTGNGKIK